MGTARVTVSVEHSYGSISEGWDVEYDFWEKGTFLSEEARKAILSMVKIIEQRLEGVR